MKVIHNRKKHTNELYDVTLICSPLEALTVMNALRRMSESEETNKNDKPIAEKMLRDMVGDTE